MRKYTEAQKERRRQYAKAQSPLHKNPDGTLAGHWLRRSFDGKAWIMELDGLILGRFETERDAIKFYNSLKSQ